MKRFTISVGILIALSGCSDPVLHASQSPNPHVGYCSEDGRTGLPTCDCPEGAECAVATFEELPKASDPGAIQQLAGITTTWDDADSVWSVEIDTLSMPAQGIVVVDGSSGRYDGLPEFFDQMSALLEQTIEPAVNDDGTIEMPPIRLMQNGVSTRLYVQDDGSASWSQQSSSSLFWNALTDADGRVWIGETLALSIAPTPNCPGTDNDSFESMTLDDLRAEQCTSWDNSTGYFLPVKVCEEMDYFGDVCFVPTFTSRTTLRLGFDADFSAGQDSPIFRCETLDAAPPYRCSVGTSHYIRVRQRANMSVRYQLFDNKRQVRYQRDLRTPDFDNLSDLLVEDTDSYGMCAHGTAWKNGTVVELHTRDGLYDPEHPLCRHK